MKRKAIRKKIEIKNKSFIEALTSSYSKRNEVHAEIIKQAKESGVLAKLSPFK